MNLKYKSLPISSVLFFLLLSACCSNLSYGANLDDLYQPLLKKGNNLYRSGIRYFRLEEEATHGNFPTYDQFDSSPYFTLFENTIRFSLLESLELALGFNQTFPARYERLTYDASGRLVSLQEFDLDYFQDYILNLRARSESIEAYLDILERSQKTAWNFAPYPNPVNYFTIIRTHYEDVKTGVRYLSDQSSSSEKSNLSKFLRPLLHNKQINLEVQLEYKSGKLKRTSDYYHPTFGPYQYKFKHTLEPHFLPEFTVRYGLNDDLELESGLSFTAPYKYKYEYKNYIPGGTSLFVEGAYKLKHSFSVPLNVRYRPEENWEITLASDFGTVNQRLDYWQKNTDNSITNFPSKKLIYYHALPTLKIGYLFDNNKEITHDRNSPLGTALLRKNQWFVEFQYQKDITSLNKNSANGPQNIIDPYNVFLYPLESYVIGTQYAAFFAGNTSGSIRNIQPQNHYLLQLFFTYGLTEFLNTGLRIGYRSSSSLHHFTLGNPLGYDLQSYFYKFKPYYFFDLVCDWRLNQDSMISFGMHFIPAYRTVLNIANQPRDFSSENSYLEVSLSYKFIF